MGIDISKLKEKFEKKAVGRSDRFTFKDKDNYIRILPPSIEYLGENVDYIAYEFYIHYGLGVEGDKVSEVCPKTFGKQHKCPICEAVWKLYKTNTLEDKALAGKIRSKVRHIFNIIDLNEVEKGIQIMETGPKIYEEIIKFITNPKWGDLLDIDKGRNFIITKTPGDDTASGYTEYSVSPDPDSTSIRSKLPQNFKDVIGMLKKQVPTAKSYDELKGILEGNPTEERSKGESDGNVPSVEVKKENITIKKEEVKEKPVDVKKEPPECFGIGYGPKRDVCLECAVKKECRTKFLEID